MFAAKLLLATLLGLGISLSATGAVVFSDDYASRPNGQDIWGTLPTTTSAGVGTYVPLLGWPFSGKIDPFTPLGKVLKFDTAIGDANGLAFLPYAYAFGSDAVELTVRAAHRPRAEGQPEGFNNFAIGFSSGGIFTDHILVQSAQIQLNFPGVNISTLALPFASADNTFYEFVLVYDPTKAGIAGSQPYSLSINGVDLAIPVLATTIYTPLAGFDGVAFGGRFSNGITVRYLTNFSLETIEATVPEPATIALLGLGLAALGMARRRSQ